MVHVVRINKTPRQLRMVAQSFDRKIDDAKAFLKAQAAEKSAEWAALVAAAVARVEALPAAEIEYLAGKFSITPKQVVKNLMDLAHSNPRHVANMKPAQAA